MPFYHKLGQIPHKRHTQFRKPDGKLYREEVMGLEGFSSLQSILYHHFLPPRVKKTADLGSAKPEYVDFGAIRADNRGSMSLLHDSQNVPGETTHKQAVRTTYTIKNTFNLEKTTVARHL